MTNPVISEPRTGVVTLSNGSVSPYEIPADFAMGTFPLDATVVCNFYDLTRTLVVSVDGTVAANRLQFLFLPTDVDPVARGYGFEVILTQDGNPYKIRYGKVVRRQASFEFAPQVAPPMAFSDNFSNRKGQAGNLYSLVAGNTTIHDNSGIGGIGATGNGLGVDIGLLYQKSSIRVNRTLSTDTQSLAAVVVDPFGVDTGATVLGICGNTGLTSGMGLLLNSQTQQVALVVVGGPNVWTLVTGYISGSVGNFDEWKVGYNLSTQLLEAFYGAGSTTPVLSWSDGGGQPHGLGYRYPFFMFDASLLTTGPQINIWAAQDDG